MVLDEFHERSLATDLALGLLRRLQRGLAGGDVDRAERVRGDAGAVGVMSDRPGWLRDELSRRRR